MMAMLVHHMRHAATSQRGNSDAWSKAWAAAKVSVLLVQDVQKGMTMSLQNSTNLPKPPKASCNHFRQHVGVWLVGGAIPVPSAFYFLTVLQWACITRLWAVWGSQWVVLHIEDLVRLGSELGLGVIFSQLPNWQLLHPARRLEWQLEARPSV